MNNDRWQIHRYLAQTADERLAVFKTAPQHILLAGADGDSGRSLLAARYPKAAFAEYDPRADFLHTAAAARKSGLLAKLAGKSVPQHCQSRLKTQGINARNPALIDMHDLGDMLADSGFYDPVTDTAALRLDYRNADTFWQDMDTLGLWRALDFDNKAAARAVVDEMWRRGELAHITLETVYGHAVKKKYLPEGENEVLFFPRNQKGGA